MASITPAGEASRTGNALIDALLWGGSWRGEDGVVALTWSAATGATPFGEAEVAGRAWRAHEHAALGTAVSLWAEVAKLSFTEVAAAGSAEADLVAVVVRPQAMRALVGDGRALGFHEVPDGSTAPPLSGVFNGQGLGWTEAGLQRGGYGFVTLVHEIGHALGLAHPHDGGRDGQVFPGVDGPRDMGTDHLNQGIWTTMSYNDGWRREYRDHAALDFGWQAGPMALDIAAVQRLYGANTTTRTGNDTYLLPVANGPGAFWSCIWDAGGTDAISAAGAAVPVVIDLREATLAGPNAGGFVSHAPGVVGGFTIARNVVIENATGGAGNDRLIGNSLPNRLDGGPGADTMIGGGFFDTYIVDDPGDRVVEEPGAFLDVVIASVTYRLPRHVPELRLSGSAAIDALGNDGANKLVGNAGANRLAGGGGGDTLRGAAGADTLVGGQGEDWFGLELPAPSPRDADRLADFDPREDWLWLDRALFAELASGPGLSSARFVVGAQALDADDRILHDRPAGRLLYDPDGTGEAPAVVMARLDPGLFVSASDFLVW